MGCSKTGASRGRVLSARTTVKCFVRLFRFREFEDQLINSRPTPQQTSNPIFSFYLAFYIFSEMVDFSQIKELYKKSLYSSEDKTPAYISTVNALLIFTCVYLLYRTVFPSLSTNKEHIKAKEFAASKAEPVVHTVYTPKTLAPFNGTDHPRVLMGVKRKVYDVSAGRSFYGPGGPYR